jgi:hypothetical protein
MSALETSKQDPISTNKKVGVVACACHPSYVAGNINRRIVAQVHLEIKARPYSKNNKSKKG